MTAWERATELVKVIAFDRNAAGQRDPATARYCGLEICGEELVVGRDNLVQAEAEESAAPIRKALAAAIAEAVMAEREACARIVLTDLAGCAYSNLGHVPDYRARVLAQAIRSREAP